MADQNISEIINDISTKLRKAREQKRFSLDEVHKATKIRVAVIKSLEKGQWNDVPGGVYLKSFIVEYAQFLGLNGEEMYEPYDALLSKAEKKKTEEIESTAQSDQRQRLVWVSAGIGVIFLLGMIRFFVIDSEPEPIEPAADEPAVVEPVPAPPPAPVPDPHTLEVFSPNPLWLRVEAEDKTFEGFIPQNSTWSWSGLGQFTIRLGHTLGVQINFDGQMVAIADNQKRVYLPDES